MSTEEKIRLLAEGVAAQGGVMQAQQGEVLVLLCAIAAIAKTHPAPEAFAAQFRRAWLQAGSKHADPTGDAQFLDGISSALAILEENCSAPLNVRPPGVASSPEQG
ncbi:MAG: hypothetical protein KF686_08210 [Ramlibacter sp.]|nr:hypothetical protein [Ramlibacter sp.]